MEFIIREAAPNDVTAMSELLVEIHDLHAAAMPVTFAPIEANSRTQELLADQLLLPDSQAFVAEKSGVLVGYIWVRLLASPPIHLFVERRFAEIDTIGVADGNRRQGIGRALVARAHDWSIAHGASEVRLVVYGFNQDAIRFYERLGYGISRYTMTCSLEALSRT